MNLRAIIVDDEPSSRNILKQAIEESCPQVEIISECTDVEAAYLSIQRQNPDLIFLDIQMPGGNGFSLLQRFKRIPFEVIFTTAFDQYAINAIKFSALDYLLKPIINDELIQAVNKAADHISKKHSNDACIVNLLSNIDYNQSDKKIALHENDKVKFVSQSSISHIEVEGSYSSVYTRAGEKFISSKSLREFEDFFKNANTFIRVNKNFLINVSYIKSYSKGEPCFIKLYNEQTLEVSRRKKTEILDCLKKQQLN